jgi:hypothetical protein
MRPLRRMMPGSTGARAPACRDEGEASTAKHAGLIGRGSATGKSAESHPEKPKPRFRSAVRSSVP